MEQARVKNGRPFRQSICCIYLVIVGLIWWAAITILAVIPLPEPIRTVVRVLLIVVLCLIVIYALLGLLPGGGFHLRRF